MQLVLLRLACLAIMWLIMHEVGFVDAVRLVAGFGK